MSACVFRSTVHQDTCNAVGTQGYPTLRYFEPAAEGAEAESAKGTKGENYAGEQLLRRLDLMMPAFAVGMSYGSHYDLGLMTHCGRDPYE